jgi:predicted TPR repeat methyltransferase
MATLALCPTLEPYDALAPAYDALTEGYRHDVWLDRILALAGSCGLRGRRVLDIACGTGKSFLPLLDAGYTVEASDLSAGMVEIAQRKAGDAATVRQEDMRDLPAHGPFDLVLCLDDAINYLLDEDELVATFRGVGANLDARGLFIFDVNTLQTYRTTFATDWAHETPEHVIVWRGSADEQAPAGARCQATVEVFTRRDEDELWQRQTSIHRQRHWQTSQLAGALAEAGLDLVTCKGQRRGADVHDDPEAPDNHKLLYVSKRRSP